MGQVIRILLVVIIAGFGYYYFRKLKENNIKYIMLSLSLGIVLVLFGGVVAYMVNNSAQILVDSLLLRDYRVSGRFIFIGYCFLLTSIFLVFGKIIGKKKK